LSKNGSFSGSDILPPLKGVGFPICRRSSWCLILSGSGLCQSSPCHGHIAHGSIACLLEPLPLISARSLIPAFGHSGHIRATSSKEYYPWLYLSAFIPPLKSVGFLLFSGCKYGNSKVRTYRNPITNSTLRRYLQSVSSPAPS